MSRFILLYIADIVQLLIQTPLLFNFLKGLDLITHFKAVPVLKANAAFGAFAHFCHILLDVFERVEHTLIFVSM